MSYLLGRRIRQRQDFKTSQVSRIVITDKPPLASLYMHNFSNRRIESVEFEFSGLMHLQ
ncbi:MAG: hypothetical protein RIS46_1000, partial [Actinomycetota bacterium]